VKPLSSKILYLYQISKNYYFELIAKRAVPKEVGLLHETIGISIIFSLIFLHCGFFEPPPIVIIFFGSEPVSSPSFSHPLNSI